MMIPLTEPPTVRMPMAFPRFRTNHLESKAPVVVNESALEANDTRKP
jgi:hypothetical protein